MATVNQTDNVYAIIRKKIEQGIYAPGESLREQQLSTEYKVSRNTIKKVFLLLESDGFVTIEPNKGTKVRSYSKQEIVDFLEFREEVEGFIIRLATPLFTESDLHAMEQILNKQLLCKENNDLLQYSQLNRSFHAVISNRCPNHTAVNVVNSLKQRMTKYNSKTVLIPGRIDQAFQEHTSILEALKEKNAEKAESAMKLHVHNVTEIYRKYYDILF